MDTNGHALPDDRLAPFAIGDGRVGILLSHGFTGTPYEMREMAVFLADHGYRVRNAKLAGHGEDPEALAQTRWPDWWTSLTDEYCALAGECDRVVMCGLSMGGVLGLHLASHYPVAGAAIFAAPVFLDNPILPYVPWLKHVMPYRPKTESDIHNDAARAAHPNIGRTPLVCVESLTQLMEHVHADLAEVHCPLLLVYSRHDSTVPYRNMEYIAGRVASEDVATYTVENSGHVVTVDNDKQAVFEQTLAFVRRAAE